MNVQKLAVFLLSAILLAGCSERVTRLHTTASLSESRGHVAVSEGSSAVLEFTKLSGLPFLPDQWYGARVFIELDAARLVPDSVVAVPADVVRCIAVRVNAPSEKSAEDCSGSLTLRSVSSTSVSATLDVTSKSLGVAIRKRLKYVRSSEQRAVGPVRPPNYAVNASVRPVTALACASVAPVRPARYRSR